ncbi:MAG: hypothetical protein JXM79_02195 [Sedimentisphaerales bacterium]|nr:hypothetical protein [Sedimentisphaerales bacterium]
MTKKDFGSVVKVFVLCVLCLCIVSSCKKATDEPEPKKESEQPVVSAAKTEEPAPTAAQPAPETPAKEEEKPAEAPKEEPKEAETPSSNTAGYVPINIELPKPMFVGTPQDTKVDNLEKPLGKPRPPFLAPEGTKNVASGKSISGSDEEPIIGELEMITDGDKEAADGSYVELGPFVQYVTLDLEAMNEIYAIVVWHYHKQARVYFDVVVQLADDKDFITNVKTVFNNDIDNSAGLGVGKDMHYTETNEGKLIDLLSQGSPKARYVRLYSNGNTSNELNHYIEVEVYGKPVN